MANSSFTFTLNSNMDRVISQLSSARRQRLLAATIEWHGGVVKLLRGTRSGRMYPIPGTQTLYRASAPGEAPAVRLGDLRTSYRFEVKDNEGLVGSPLSYAKDLEFGTRKMAPRPHLKRAFMQNKQKILAHLQSEWL